MVNKEYDFTQGLYRARIKTTYKRSDMSMSDHIFSDPFEFRSIKIPPVPPAKDTWAIKEWPGFSNIYGEYVWTDGDDIYFSRNSDQYTLNKETGEWELTTDIAVGLPVLLNGNRIWYYDGVPYFSYSKSYQYYWNKYGSDGNKWVKVTQWSNLAPNNGQYIWTDGDNVYYSNSSTQYVLNKETDLWGYKTWIGLTNFYGYYIWSDGDDVYYSNGSDQYVLNRQTATWESKNWGELYPEDGRNVWNDGDDVYYSNLSTQYVLNKNTKLWEPKLWNDYTPSYGEHIWTDGNDIYCSIGSTQLVLTEGGT